MTRPKRGSRAFDSAAARWALPALLAVVALLACTRTIPLTEPVVQAAGPQETQVRIFASASVLITAELDAGVPLVESIRVSPSLAVLDLGDSVGLSAEAIGSDGEPLSDVEFVWTVVDHRAGSIDADGRFQAGTTPGQYDNVIAVTGIQNTPDGIKFAKTSVSVTVVGDVAVQSLDSVEIIPRGPVLFSQQIYRLRAVGFGEHGVLIPGVSFVWKLNDARLGHINDIGYLTVRAEAGTYRDAVTVTAIWDDARLSASTDISIMSAPKADDFLSVQALPQRFFLEPKDQLQLRAVALNGLGELVSGTRLRWSVQDARAGTVDGTGSFIAGTEPGVYTEALRVEAIVPGERGFVRAEDFASVVIRQPGAPGRLSIVAVQPPRLVLQPGSRFTLLPRAVDESGQPVQDVALSWEVLEPDAGQISDLGAFTAGTVPGVYPESLRVTAVQTLDGEEVVKTRAVGVSIAGSLTSAEIQPSLATVVPGRTIHFTVRGWDENSLELPGLVVVWSLADKTVGTIDAFGNLTAAEVPGLYENVVRAKVVQSSRGVP